MKANRHPSATQPIPSDKPLIPETELARTKRLERDYILPPDEHAAILAKWPILKPRQNNRNGYYVQRGS